MLHLGYPGPRYSEQGMLPSVIEAVTAPFFRMYDLATHEAGDVGLTDAGPDVAWPVDVVDPDMSCSSALA